MKRAESKGIQYCTARTCDSGSVTGMDRFKVASNEYLFGTIDRLGALVFSAMVMAKLMRWLEFFFISVRPIRYCCPGDINARSVQHKKCNIEVRSLDFEEYRNEDQITSSQSCIPIPQKITGIGHRLGCR